jgi:uncharacterized protein
MTAESNHRPYPCPKSPWVIEQSWDKLLFAHWPVPKDKILQQLPPQLQLDLYQGQAWVGITPFYLRGMRPRGFFSIPGISDFPEINVRTYVTYKNKPGIYFFSLDTTSLLAVMGARSLYHLPYFKASISWTYQNDTMDYRHCRHEDVAFRAFYGPVSTVFQAVKDSLEYWLVERYCLYTVDKNQHLYSADIHHGPWPLQQAAADITENSLIQYHLGPLSLNEPLYHYSHHQKTLIWPVRRLT